MIKKTVGAVGTALMLTPFGMPLVAHSVAGLIVGTVGLNLINGVINDVKGAGDALQQEMSKSHEWEPEDEPESH
jgi:hypothetical protein